MTDPINIIDLHKRLDQLESENSIHRLVVRYFDLCDKLGPDVALEELSVLFRPDAQWRGTGTRYSEAFGTLQNRQAIVAMLDRYRGPPPHFVLNAHFLSCETIVVSGDSATGSWMMLQTSTYRDGACDLRAAKLRLEFARSEGEWQILTFETQNLFSRRVDHWNDMAPILVPADQGESRV